MNATDTEKRRQLNAHKALATGLFLAMLLLYACMVWLARHHPASWIGYVSAFSEAAMVGALADWFAVTALFHHPLGIPIPHTNLIERGKKSIGDNLGNFVVTNFLTPDTIRPYIERLTISAYAAEWIDKEKNKKLVVKETAFLLGDIVSKMDSKTISAFIAKKGAELLEDIKLNTLVANALKYFLDRDEHEPLITLLAQKITIYIGENQSLVRDRVKDESYFFIPKFVDNKLAEKITTGLMSYFAEIAEDKHHRIRQEVTAQLYDFVEKLRTEPKWETEFRSLSKGLLSPQKLEEYAEAAWLSLKANLQEELAQEDSALTVYFSKTLSELVTSLRNDLALQQRIDGWIHVNAYQYILRNTQQVGDLISNTIGNWKGNELSRKLELEVGKDLQFIRINGTIVGGLMGLLIYTVTLLVGK